MLVILTLSTGVCIKYIRVARGKDGLEVKSMIDVVLVKKAMLRYGQDVKTGRGMGRGLTDHYILL